MQGQDWKSALWQAAEAAHLKEDVKLLAKLAKASQEDVISASFWCEELQLASSLLAKASIPSEAAAAMYYRGWSLLRLGRPVAAQETLQLGSLLAGRARVKKGVAELLAKELGVLTSMSRSSEPSEVAEAPGPLVVEVQEASQAMDPGRRLLVLDLDSARHVLNEARDSDLPSDLAEQLKLRYWMLLPGPANFSWAIYDPPSSLLAVSASPIEAEQLALQSLGLIRQVRADGLDGQPPDHHGVVKEVAEALKAGAGCLLHSLQGGAASASSGTALACFLCRFGLGIPEDWEAQEPALSAEEAVDLAQGLRGSQGQHVDSAAVAFYEQSLWSELVMSRIARRSRRAADSPADGSEGGILLVSLYSQYAGTTARRLPAGTQVLKQPGDGNCLFHSLAKGLGGKETASGLRRRICSFMRDSPDLDISGTSLADWVQMVAQSSVGNYAQRMERAGEWGGAPEIAVCAHMVGINIYVYEPCGREFELVAPFMCTDKMSSSKDAVHVLYSGRMHYDAMTRTREFEEKVLSSFSRAQPLTHLWELRDKIEGVQSYCTITECTVSVRAPLHLCRGRRRRTRQFALCKKVCNGCLKLWGMKPSALYAPPGIGAVQALSFPHTPDCAHCETTLKFSEARWGTGLCKTCYGTALKDCSVCKKVLPLKQLQWGKCIARPCYNASEKQCRVCEGNLAFGRHWGTGLCDRCYGKVKTSCRMCRSNLDPHMLHWGTGLCDPCYNSCQKDCTICSTRLEGSALLWGSGLCDRCYDSCEQTCAGCQSKIALGSLHWRSALCDGCYDARSKTCKFCDRRLGAEELRTGLCTPCYSSCPRTCKKCCCEIGDQAVHWGSGLCDVCYDVCEKCCKLCSQAIALGEMHWGSGLCDACYMQCEKTCRLSYSDIAGFAEQRCRWDSCTGARGWRVIHSSSCEQPISIGDCCYDSGVRPTPQPLSGGVKATIAAQLLFYLTVGMLQPFLFLQIRDLRYKPSAPTVYAAVLTCASVAGMFAPVPLGIWAERRGEREVYYGLALLSAIAAAALAVEIPSPIFALAWAALSVPPAVRGVRAAYFAKHVAPEDLSRAGQLASSAGLTGGFLGPLASGALTQVFGDGSDDGRWPTPFLAGAIFSATASLAFTLALAWTIPKEAKKKGGNRYSCEGREWCERCSRELNETELGYATALCDNCYDSFRGAGYSFGRFCRNVLIAFCVVAALLEVSMNAGVIAAFQPIAVSHFGWGSDSVAAVNFAGAAFSVVISLLMAHLRLPERTQMAIAAGLYLSGVLVFTTPPLSQWRLVVGLMLGIKAGAL
ncbi:unnamed protein product [Polarella glacialis]|uniref:Ubiquitin thioesterase OTU n=1 Tax=Polarella glacialis TaxID=89957 RepID=A0A813HHK3_POLGL|nr:unnamed protein product [Polarella glacialis]